jgi:hypothetical protein
MHREDVGMLQPGGEMDLALETFGAESGGELGEEDLERDGTVVAEVVSEIDDGHSAAPELALDSVAIGKGVAERVRDSDVELLRWREGDLGGGSRGPVTDDK